MKRIEKINNCINELLRYYEKLDFETQKNLIGFIGMLKK